MVLRVVKSQSTISRSLLIDKMMAFSMWVDNVQVPANEIILLVLEYAILDNMFNFLAVINVLIHTITLHSHFS